MQPGEIKAQITKQPESSVSKDPEFAVGNIIGTRANIDSFKLQKEIKVTKGYRFKSANVYFTGANFPMVKFVLVDTSSLYQLETFIQKCVAGSAVTFDSVKLVDKRNAVISVDRKTYLFYPSGTGNNPPIERSAVYKEFMELYKLNFISGTVYFSGENFSNVVIVYITKATSLKNLIDRCGPGSIIALENCIYKNADGTLSKTITKTIKLD